MIDLSQKKVSPVDKLNFDGEVGESSIEFTITVPLDQELNTCLDKSWKDNRYDFLHYSNLITDEACKHTTDMLKPGKTYRVKLHPVIKDILGSRCLYFVEIKNSLLVGAQGILIISQQGRDMFPPEAKVIAFDKRGSSPRIGNYFMAPAIYKEQEHSKYFYDFLLEEFDGPFGPGSYILLVNEVIE